MTNIVFIVVIGIMAMVFALGHGARRREVGSKAATRDARRGIAVIGITLLLGVGFYRFLPGLWGDPSKRGLLFFLLAAPLWASIAWLSWRKRQGGRVLLDLGRSRLQKMQLVAGCFIAGLNMLVLVGRLLGTEDAMGVDISQLLFGISLGVLFLVLGLSHVEIRERGIFYSDRFVKWVRVESYAWEGEGGLTLTLEVQGRLSVFRHLSLPVPSIHKEAIEDLLARNLSGNKGTT